MKKSPVIYPFLFSIFPILSLYAHNKHELLFSITFVPSAIVLGATFLLVLLLGAILKNYRKAGLVVALMLFLFFSYNPVNSMIEGWKVGNLAVPRGRYLLSILGAFFILAVYLIIKTRSNLHNFTNILNIAAFSLLAIPLLDVGAYNFKANSNLPDHDSSTADIEVVGSPNGDILRDIYYIVLDGHASSSTLKTYYDYDNHEFTDYLAEKGFYIADKSQSNYAHTHLSLASTLNMEYINYLSDGRID